MSYVYVGKPARITLTFKDESGTKYDPAGVKLFVGLIVPRSGQRLYESTYIYPAGDGTIVKDGTGEYHADITMPEPGISRVVAVDIAEALSLAENAA